MHDLLTILYYLNQHSQVTQRDIAQATGVSLGKINHILKRLEENQYIRIQRDATKSAYYLTPKGMQLLEQDVKETAQKKIRLAQASQKVSLAVILAAGAPRGIEQPVPLLPLGEATVLDRTMQVLRDNGIEQVIIVAGYRSEALEAHVAQWANVQVVTNPAFHFTGTMASLAAAAPYIDQDFLLVEGDLIFEERGIQQLMHVFSDSAMLITSVRKQHDEAMVEVRNGYIYKMGKDIHQFNRIDGEMIGLSKLSFPYFQKMLEIYQFNQNKWVNYEYIMLDVAHEYRLGYVKLDDYVWGEIDEASQQDHVLNTVYPRLLRKEQRAALEQVKQFLHEHMQATDDDIQLLESAGGMTNKNYKVVLRHQPYIIRIAGNGTDKFINRSAEKVNSHLAHILGLDVETRYFDETTGTKVSAFIEEAETLNQNTAKYPSNMAFTTSLLRKLHQSGLDFDNRFDVFEEIKKYERFVDEVNAPYFEGYAALREQVFALQDDLAQLPEEIVPCHIDTVPENFVKGAGATSYLIDWEYSGMNDLAWDLAAHSLECDFSAIEEAQFLQLYCQSDSVPESLKTKMAIFKICQDFLWSVWTIFKESRGDQFGDYGMMRYTRAAQNMAAFLERKD